MNACDDSIRTIQVIFSTFIFWEQRNNIFLLLFLLILLIVLFTVVILMSSSPVCRWFLQSFI